LSLFLLIVEIISPPTVESSMPIYEHQRINAEGMVSGRSSPNIHPSTPKQPTIASCKSLLSDIESISNEQPSELGTAWSSEPIPRCSSPVSGLSCDGYCDNNSMEVAHVVSHFSLVTYSIVLRHFQFLQLALGACKDHRHAWEDPQGHSMTSVGKSHISAISRSLTSHTRR
jgi:hypothetical protein